MSLQFDPFEFFGFFQQAQTAFAQLVSQINSAVKFAIVGFAVIVYVLLLILINTIFTGSFKRVTTLIIVDVILTISFIIAVNQVLVQDDAILL